MSYTHIKVNSSLQHILQDQQCIIPTSQFQTGDSFQGFHTYHHILHKCETIWAKVKATADLSLSLCFEFLLSEPLGVTLVQACLTDVKCRLLQLRLNLL